MTNYIYVVLVFHNGQYSFLDHAFHDEYEAVDYCETVLEEDLVPGEDWEIVKVLVK